MLSIDLAINKNVATNIIFTKSHWELKKISTDIANKKSSGELIELTKFHYGKNNLLE